MPTGDEIRQVLRRVQEPTLGADVVELGLVFEVWIGDAGYVHVNMTSPRPGSTQAVYLAERVREALLMAMPELHQVEVSVLAEPRWEPAMMSDEARRRLLDDTDG
jgi:metal-sulfur cluster biosynthetic enzyme